MKFWPTTPLNILDVVYLSSSATMIFKKFMTSSMKIIQFYHKTSLHQNMCLPETWILPPNISHFLDHGTNIVKLRKVAQSTMKSTNLSRSISKVNWGCNQPDSDIFTRAWKLGQLVRHIALRNLVGGEWIQNPLNYSIPSPFLFFLLSALTQEFQKWNSIRKYAI